MIYYTIQTIAEVIEADITGNTDSSVVSFAIDSRRITSPHYTMFFAITGERHDGHTFIPELYKKGVRAFVVKNLPEHFDHYTDTVFLKVPNVLEALQKFASYHREHFSYPVIGITGSNGKTTIKEWLAQILQYDKRIVRSPKSYNSQVGVPLSLLLMDHHYDLGIFEAGISKPDEMEQLGETIIPDIGIFSNIGEAHQENFSSINEKINEKIKLFKHSNIIIYCKDHTHIDKALQEQYHDKLLLSWSMHEQAYVTIKDITQNNSHTHIDAIYNNSNFRITIPFIDNASIENTVHIITLLCFWNYEFDTIRQRMKQLTPIAMRLELKEGINNCTLINDSYNSDFNSLTIAIDFLNQQKHHLKKTVILSDMLQSGRKESELYEAVARLIKEKQIAQFIGIGPALSRNSSLFPDNAQFYETVNDFLQAIHIDSFYNKAILIKGARNFQVEQILKVLEEKAHRTILEIDLDALVHNLNYFQSKLNPETKIMVMVKAFSYGSGLHEVAHLLQYHRVDYLGVAFTDEGIALRKSGISIPILVMEPEDQNFDHMVEYKLEPEIFNFERLHLLIEMLKEQNIKNYPVHIKVDTGMHRLGFDPEEIPELITSLKNTDTIKVVSVFSHLAASDEPQHDSFTAKQIQKLEHIKKQFSKTFSHHILYHILNSGGIERFPEAQMDMVRLGIGIYGISAIDNSRLRNISTLKSKIIQIKTVQPNETVGYGRAGQVEHEKQIAVVPIGYADGINRKLSNGNGHFFVNGQPAPIIGTVCMDVTMIDITGIQAQIGDEVIIFGDIYPVYTLAQDLGTIPYEVLTSISQRVKRIYFQET